MSAAEALTQARAAGIRVGIDGDQLALEASAPPPGEVLDLLAQYKADILTLLRLGCGGWTGEDWREFFEERAGIAEFDGGLSRDQAEAQAFSCCVGKWLHRTIAIGALRSLWPFQGHVVALSHRLLDERTRAYMAASGVFAGMELGAACKSRVCFSGKRYQKADHVCGRF
jgi:hypothetical protein